MNTTFNVASLFNCNEITKCWKNNNIYDPIWRQTSVGCHILNILKEIYGFNISYVYENALKNITVVGEEEKIILHENRSIDIYVRPMSYGLHNIHEMYPVYPAYRWRFGFIFRQENKGFYNTFYSKPFSRPVWNHIYGLGLFVSIFLYFLKKWEFGIIGGWECSFPYELLMVWGAFCQHIPPIDATLPSRRIAYFIFFMFTYTTYTFYTSNLLSHLVNDKKHELSLEALASTNLELVIVDYMKLMLTENVPSNSNNYTIIVDKLHNLRSVSLRDGLRGMKAGKMALLSDYTSLFPFANSFNARRLICELYTVDLFSKIQKYFFVSKEFPFKEQFKIGAIRAKEAGLIKFNYIPDVPTCEKPDILFTTLEQISTPLIVLLCTYIFSIIILVIENVHYNRNKVWPYVN